jgi:hypothetical protein
MLYTKRQHSRSTLECKRKTRFPYLKQELSQVKKQRRRLQPTCFGGRSHSCSQKAQVEKIIIRKQSVKKDKKIKRTFQDLERRTKTDSTVLRFRKTQRQMKAIEGVAAGGSLITAICEMVLSVT